MNEPDLGGKVAPKPSLIQFLAHLPRIFQDPISYFKKVHEIEGDVVRLQIGPKLFAHLLGHPEALQHILLTNRQNYRKVPLYKLVRVGFGQGLVLSEGELWKRQRRMIQPHFNHDKLERHYEAMVSVLESELGRWEYFAERGTVIDVETEMLKIANKVTLQILMGEDISQEVEQARRNFMSAARISLLTGNLPTPQERRTVKAFDELSAQIYRMINEHRQKAHQNTDLMGLLMESRDRQTGERMPDEQLHDEIVTLIFTGFESQARALTWLWYSLGTHPEIRNQVLEELREVLKGTPPTFTDLSRLGYTSKVIHETLRLYPISYAGSRRSIECDEVMGFDIPADSDVVLNYFYVHRHPDFWPDPEKFDPLRFPEREGITTGLPAYFPFGSGPRNCLGNQLALVEMKMIVAVVAQRFELRLPRDHRASFDSTPFLRPRGGMPARVFKR